MGCSSSTQQTTPAARIMQYQKGEKYNKATVVFVELKLTVET